MVVEFKAIWCSWKWDWGEVYDFPVTHHCTGVNDLSWAVGTRQPCDYSSLRLSGWSAPVHWLVVNSLIYQSSRSKRKVLLKGQCHPLIFIKDASIGWNISAEVTWWHPFINEVIMHYRVHWESWSLTSLCWKISQEFVWTQVWPNWRKSWIILKSDLMKWGHAKKKLILGFKGFVITYMYLIQFICTIMMRDLVVFLNGLFQESVIIMHEKQLRSII